MPNKQKEASFAGDSKYLTFELNNVGYGVDILRVREIMGMLAVTPIPKTPEAVLGVINLRGKVIPIVDFRAQLGLLCGELTDKSCIVVLDLSGQQGGDLHIGVVVDSVNDVRNISTQDMEPSPDFGENVTASEYIDAMAKCEDGVRIIVNIDRVLTDNDLSTLATASN